jgi:hypothetical protein
MLMQTNISVNGEADINSEEFWAPLRTVTRGLLNGRIRVLHLIHAPGEAANISEILPNVNGFGVEDLTVVGVHWPRLQKNHLRKMSHLRVLNVSGNGIAFIANGK